MSKVSKQLSLEKEKVINITINIIYIIYQNIFFIFINRFFTILNFAYNMYKI